MSNEENKLTDSERKDRDENVAAIKEALGNFLLTGERLRYLNENRLYKEHGTFDEFVHKEFQMDDSRAYQLIDAYEVVAEMKKRDVKVLPLHESHCRELHGLIQTPAIMVDVWESVLAKGKVTSEMIKEEVARRTGKVQWSPASNGRRPAKVAAGRSSTSVEEGEEEDERKWEEEEDEEEVDEEAEESESEEAEAMTLPSEGEPALPPLEVMANVVRLLEWLPDHVDADEKWAALCFKAQMCLGRIVAKHKALSLVARGDQS